MNLREVLLGHQDRRASTSIAVLVTAALLLAAYLLLRFGGRWGETDSWTFAGAIQAMLDAGQLVPSSGAVYANGYAYQALAVFIIQLGGITTSQFQLVFGLFLFAWIIFPAWLLFRELTGNARGATLAAAILLAQPEFLFYMLRGTHEKFTRGLILLALYLFVKSLRPNSWGRVVSYLLAFYLAVYAAIAFNNLLAFSLIAALGLALLLLVAVRWWTRSRNPTGSTADGRLRYTVLSAGVLVFLFTFYFYLPARNNVMVMQSMLDRTASLLLDVTYVSGANPYAYTAGAWISGPVYLVLSIANWLLLGFSAGIWLWQTWKLLRYRDLSWQTGQLLLWVLYSAFAIQEALSILVDFSGALAANLQVRAFPAFVIMAAPLVARALVDFQASGSRLRGVAWSATAGILAILSVLSILKATNEPLVSNKWSFYIPAEMRALDRAESILPDAPIWTESDERLITARGIRIPSRVPDKNLEAWGYPARNVLVSDVTRDMAARTLTAPPTEADSFVVYDNGQAQLYHLRPRTPFQR